MNKRFSRFLPLLLALTWMTGCAVNPVTGKNELSFIPEGQELAIGAQQYLPSQQSQGGEFKVDPELTSYVSEVGQRVASVSDRNLPYEFVVLNNSVPNAWALPGGKIAINRGLLTELDNEAELAAVLGHEVVHAAAKHGVNAMQRGMLLQGAVALTAIASAESDYGNYVVGGAQVGAQLLSQKYGRSAELESDYYGTQYIKRAGYNPEAAVALQETFVRLSEGQQASWLDGLFSSHPPSQERVAANRETAASLGASGDLGRDRYQARIAYLKSTEDVYAAFDQAMQLASNGEYAPALARVNQAIAKEPREARFYGLRGDILHAQGKYKEATSEFDKAIRRDDNYYEYYLGRGLARSEMGQRAGARSDLERSNELLPTAIANNALGQISLAAGDRGSAKNYFETAMQASGNVGQNAATEFIKLDLPDNPSRYVTAEPSLTQDRRLVAQVANLAAVAVRDVRLEFEVVVNGETQRRTVTVNSIGSRQQGNVVSGLQFAETDVITSARATVTSAAVSQ